MKAIKVLAITIGVIVLLIAVLAVSGLGGSLFFKGFIAYNKPAGDFDPSTAVSPPDYSLEASWAALPAMSDPADLVPQGIVVAAQGEQLVDVFFIHPTGFLTSGSWNSPMGKDSGTEENTQWMMANQASAFNGCCNIYAPRYRQANIFAYFGDAAARDRVLGLAFEDVKRSFEYYLAHYNQGRPFIIAGHSQGSHQAKRLLREVIDSSELHRRMIAAYMIGSIVIPVSPSWFDSLSHIGPCASAEDLHCVVQWDTMPEDAPPLERPEPSLCTNPLSWRVDEQRVAARFNEGAVAPLGLLNTAIGNSPDLPTQQRFEALAAPVPSKTWAQCKDGTLYVDRRQGIEFEAVANDGMGTFHALDYALFYMNIHNNAKLRSSQFLAGHSESR